MAKKTVSYFSVVEFFGFRLAIPFENPLSLTAAVTHAVLYPERTISDELGVLSLQYLLDAPEAFIDIVQSREGGIQNAARARYPISFPLSLKQLPGFSTSESSAPQLHKVLERSLLFGLFDDSEHTAGTDTSEHQIAGQLSQQTSTPFLEQLCRSFSANNLREHQVELLHWLKEILVLYEQKVGSHLTYIFYPYHPYLLKQVKRFGPLGSFFAQQFEHDPEQLRRMRHALLHLLVPQQGQPDYLENLVRPLLIYEYATILARIGWQLVAPDVKHCCILIASGLSARDVSLYALSSSPVPLYLGTVELPRSVPLQDGRSVVQHVIRKCFTLKGHDLLLIALFRAGQSPLEDEFQFFHCANIGVYPLGMYKPLEQQKAVSVHSRDRGPVQMELAVPSQQQDTTESGIHARSIKIVMQDIERIASLEDVERFERLKWIDRLLNFHLVLYLLDRGVHDCNCWRALSSEEMRKCARFFAMVDCTREFRSEVAEAGYTDFAFLRNGIRRNYRQFIEGRLGQIGVPPPNVSTTRLPSTQLKAYWKHDLRQRDKTAEKFFEFLRDTVASLPPEQVLSPLQLWSEALVHYFSSSGGDLFRIYEVINTHGRMIGFVEPTTGRSSRRKLTMNPSLLVVLIHCLTTPGQRTMPISDFLQALYTRYGLIVNLGDAKWHRLFTEPEEKERIEGWVSTLGEQNTAALHSMLREAGLLIEYSDANAEIIVHYGHTYRPRGEREEHP